MKAEVSIPPRRISPVMSERADEVVAFRMNSDMVGEEMRPED